MRKKVLVTFLSLLILLGLFAGCSGNNESSSASEISESAASDPDEFQLDEPFLENTSIISSGVKISWKAVQGAEYYSVLLSQNDGTWLLLTTTSYLQYTDKEVENNHKYTYTVICSSKNGEQLSNPSEMREVSFFSAPEISDVHADAEGVSVSWAEIDGIHSYRVMRKITGGNWEVVGHSSELSYTDKTAQAGTQYTYTVCCEDNTANSLLSGYSESGKTIKYLETPVISKTGFVGNSVKVEWEPVEGAESYSIMRRIDGEDWEVLQNLTANTFTDESVKSNTEYAYTVRCVSSDGSIFQSGYDSEGKTLLFLNTPELSGLLQDEDDVLVTWEEVEGAQAYRVYRKSEGGKYESIAVTTDTRYWDEDLEIASYEYTVRCVTEDGKSFCSAAAPGLRIEMD